MNEGKTTPHCLPETALTRIAEAQAILLQIKKWQEEDGIPEFPRGALPAYDDYTSLLLRAGFIYKIDQSPEGGTPFRITWKGLAFLDTVELLHWANSHPGWTKENTMPIQIALAAFSFH